MATVVSVNEDFRSRTFAVSSTQLTGTRSFKVIFSSTDSSAPVDAVKASGIPEVGDSFPGIMPDSLTAPVCVNVSTSPLNAEDPNHFLVTCSYSDAPVRTTPRVTISSVREPIPLEVVKGKIADMGLSDFASAPTTISETGQIKVLNNAGDPYDPPLMGERIKQVFQIKMVYPSTTACSGFPQTYTDGVNDADVSLWDDSYLKHTLRILNVNPVKVPLNADESTYVWHVTFDIEHDPRGQYVPVLESGWEYLDANNAGKPTPFMTEGTDGRRKVRARHPGLLNPTGGELVTGQGPYYSGYWPYPIISYTALNLPALVV
jgi:hypothetical protein